MMFWIGVGDRMFHLSFRHNRAIAERRGIKAITTCVITVCAPAELLTIRVIRFTAIGNAICDAGDNFSRRTGRERALLNAVNSCGALEGARMALLAAYKQLDPDPPPPAPRPKLSFSEKRDRWQAGWRIRKQREAVRVARGELGRRIAGESAQGGAAC